MRVEFLNKEEFLDGQLFQKWGEVSAVCYNTPLDKAKGIGKSCLKTGHFSGSRGIYFKFKIMDVPRSEIDQQVRHDVGTFKNVQSFRYVNKSGFDYYTSDVINGVPEAKKLYDETMGVIAKNYAEIISILESNGIAGEVANQSTRGILPMNTNSEFVMGFTLEALSNFMNKRLCTRAEEHIRKVANLIKKEVLDVVPELKEYLVPQCDKLMYCPEGLHGKTCPRRISGNVISKKKLEELLTIKR